MFRIGCCVIFEIITLIANLILIFYLVNFDFQLNHLKLEEKSIYHLLVLFSGVNVEANSIII